MRCLSPARRQANSIFYVEKKVPDTRTTPAWKEASHSVRWEEFVAHSASVTCLALGRKSGRVMVTGGEDKKVNLWAVGKSNCIMSLSGHTAPIECVKFGQCEDIVCAGSTNGALKIWDLEAAKILRTLLGHKGNVKCVDFHPYGDFIASGSSDSSIKLWDKRRKGSIFTYKGHPKSVNSLKFSPDGRWIASGCEDGLIKVIMQKIKLHSPCLNCKKSKNGIWCVKFWDLENYRLVSSTDGDSGPVQKIYFSPNGACLFSGAQDILKVYAWEPIRTLDTLVMGWGQVSDISSSESQLIVGAFSLTNVSVYIMDLKKVQLFDSWNKQQTSCIVPTLSNDSAFEDIVTDYEDESSQFIERIDFLDNCPSNVENADLSKTRVISVDLSTFLPPLEDPVTTLQNDFGSKNSLNCTYKIANVEGKPTLLALPMAVAHPYNYEKDKIHQNSTEILVEQDSQPAIKNECVQFPNLNKTSDFEVFPSVRNKPFGIELDDFLPVNADLSKTRVISVDLSTFLPPLEDPVTTLQNDFGSKNSLNCTYKIANVEGKPTLLALPMAVAHPYNYEKDKIHQNSTEILVEQDSQPAIKNECVQFPNLNKTSDFEVFPSVRNKPFGIELDDFLPRSLLQPTKGSYNSLEISDAEAISSIYRGHDSMVKVLGHRKIYLQTVLRTWRTEGSVASLTSAVHISDSAVLVDILTLLVTKPTAWTLDICQLLLPVICDLLKSKYETYIVIGCMSLKLIVKNFAQVIKFNMSSHKGIGIDISREERHKKCRVCFNHLMSLRSLVLQRQSTEGPIGKLFTELYELLKVLER
nr:katanin p80 WD40 repeat-containing subunit B1 [Parasteatoda tepidariorum]